MEERFSVVSTECFTLKGTEAVEVT